MRKNLNHYELLPTDVLFVTPIVRSIKDVMKERMKVAQWFEPNEEKAQVLTGSCAVFKSSLKIDGSRLTVGEKKLDVDPNLHLQDMIDVYNNLTAEDVLKMYSSNSEKKARRAHRAR